MLQVGLVYMSTQAISLRGDGAIDLDGRCSRSEVKHLAAVVLRLCDDQSEVATCALWRLQVGLNLL